MTTAVLSERGQTAPRYAQRGLAVFPCFTAHDGACSCGNPECRSIGKHPIGALVPEGLKDASTDPARITDWWVRCPDANIAVRPWPQRFVIDIDPKHGGDTSWADLEAAHGAVQTATTRTGSNGRHLWFTAPAEGVTIRSRTAVRPGIDVRAAGRYVIAAGSVNGSGRYYWDGSSAPVAPPAWLVDLVADTARPRAQHALTAAGERVSEGGRNAYLTRKAGQLRRPGFSVDAMIAALVQLNQEACDPPLEAAEIRQIAESVGRYAPADEHTGAEQAPSSWRLLDDAQLMALPDPEWLVVDVAPRRGVGVIYGPSGGAKTTLVAQLCLSIATGRPFCGHDVRHRGACVYVATEDPSGFKVRMRAAKIGARLSLDVPVGVFTFPEAIDLRDPVSVVRFSRFLQSTQFASPLELVVLDTYAAAMPGASENSSEDTMLAMAHTHLWREQLNATIVLVHHSNAGGTRERGHSSMRGAADFMVAMMPVDDAIHVECNKQRNGSPFVPFTLKLVPVPEGGCVLRLASDVLPSTHLSISQQKVFAVLRETFSSDGATKSEWERACQDIPGRTFHRAAKVLAERGHVKVLNSRYRVIGDAV